MHASSLTLQAGAAGGMSAALADTDLLGFQRRNGATRPKAAFVGFNAVVTVNDTSDTNHGGIAGPAVSLRDASIFAGSHAFTDITFSLPASSTITLTSPLPNPTQFLYYDFSGATNLTINGFSSVVRDFVGAQIHGGFSDGTSAGLYVNSPGASAYLESGAFINATAAAPAVSIQQGVLEALNGSSLTAVSGNVISAVGLDGASLTIHIGQGATVSDSATTSSSIYINSDVVGGVTVIDGTVSSTGNCAYVGNADAALFVGGTGLATTAAAGGVGAVQLNDVSSLDNAGSVTNTGTAAGGIGVYVSGAGTVVNSGTISTASSNGYAVGLQAGATVTSTGAITASANTNYAVATFGGAGTATTVNLNAGSTTTGAVGGTSGSALAITVAGSLNGNIVGGAEADTLRLVNGLTFSRVISLGGGGDVLTLDGANGSSTLQAGNVVSSVAVVKSGGGTWLLNGSGANFTGVAFNAGTLELSQGDSAGSGAITFAAGAQTLQVDVNVGVFIGPPINFFAPGANFALASTLTGFGAEDAIDIHNTTVTAAMVSGNALILSTASGYTATLTFASGQLANRAVSFASDGAGGSLVHLATAIPVAPPAPPSTGGAASVAANYPAQESNLLHVSAAAQAAAANDPGSSLGKQLAAEKQIAADLDAGRISPQDAQSALFHLVDGTTSAAEISYAFFTGGTPSAAGLAYLVDPTVNPNSLNSGYYATLTTENRYINLAASLSTGEGAGAAAFAQTYGALSVAEATAKAYGQVFGITPDADKVDAILNALVSDGRGGLETRAQYFADITGGGSNTLGEKAAIIGFLLADSVKEGFGVYQQANLHFLQDLAHGAPAYGVDLVAAYSQPVTTVGTASVDHSAGG